MIYSKFIKPKDVEISGRTFSVSKIPALEAQEIYKDIAKAYMDNGALGLTMLGTATIKRLLSFAAWKNGDSWVELDTGSHIELAFEGDMYSMQSLVKAMIEENYGFLLDGSLLSLLGGSKAEADSGL